MNPEDHAPAAYAASVLAAQPLSRALLGDRDQAPPVLSPTLLAAMSAAQGEEVTEEEVGSLTQKMMSVKVDLHQKQKLLEGVGEEEVRDRARLSSLGLPHAGDWVNTAPLTSLGLHLRPREFVLVVKYRLGLPVYDRSGPCPACYRHSDALGDHAMSCGCGGERISRHNQLGDALYDTAVAAGLGPTKEGRFLIPGMKFWISLHGVFLTNPL